MQDNQMLVEPFRIKMVEPIRMLSREEREERIRKAGYNVFALTSDDVFIDLLTDSGTGAMSDRQWGAMMMGDEAYAGSRSFFALEKSVQDVLGYRYVIPTHQGRGAEQVLFPLLIEHEGQYVLGNMHFDTTKAHIELAKGRGINLVIEDAFDTATSHPFKGNLDVDKLRKFISDHGTDTVAFILLTITCNSAGGQPVSMQNIREVAQVAREYGLPFFFDAARYAENAYFISQREPEFRDVPLPDIIREMLSYADGLTMSAKKDGLVNMGGMIAIREDASLYQKCRAMVIPYEGFPTYGGLAGRDLAALAEGLREGTDKDYLAYRIDQVAYLGNRLSDLGIPIQTPVGGHAVFIDARAFLPNVPASMFPAQALTVELYREAGIRSVEVGSFLLGRDPDTGEQLESPVEFVRLTIPRRTYTYRHMDYIAQAVKAVYDRRDSIGGVRIVEEPPVLRHFLAKLEPVSEV